MKVPSMGRGHAAALLASFTLFHAGHCLADEPALSGDLGLGAAWSQGAVRGAREHTSAVPWLNLEYGRAFARVDTFGVGVAPLGYGHIELIGQLRDDGYDVPGRRRRDQPLPVGVGTLQVTPIGAFGMNLLHDLGPSGGLIWQARYLAELRIGRVTIYPEVGVEVQSARFTRYYLGPEPGFAAAAAGHGPGAAVDPYAGALIQVPLAPHWVAVAYVRHVRFDPAARDGTGLGTSGRSSALAALAYRF